MKQRIFNLVTNLQRKLPGAAQNCPWPLQKCPQCSSSPRRHSKALLKKPRPKSFKTTTLRSKRKPNLQHSDFFGENLKNFRRSEKFSKKSKIYDHKIFHFHIIFNEKKRKFLRSKKIKNFKS